MFKEIAGKKPLEKSLSQIFRVGDAPPRPARIAVERKPVGPAERGKRGSVIVLRIEDDAPSCPRKRAAKVRFGTFFLWIIWGGQMKGSTA